MAIIKTALEIALEKTESVRADKTSIDQYETRQQGKKLANDYLAGEADLAGIFKKTPSERRESLKQGILDVLIPQITLPSGGEADLKKLETLGKGLEIVINNSRFTAMFRQMMQLFSQFLEESAQYDKALRQQYAPKLRQKEEEIARRIGREVRIDPMQDPEFITFYNQHMNALKANYEGVIEQVKEEARIVSV